jgi:hypothetical protein
MQLEYPPEWKFEPPAIEIPGAAHHAFLDVVGQIAKGQSAYLVFQTFKEHFGMMGRSTNASWAETDMTQAMGRFVEDAVGYLAQFWAAMEELKEREVPVPDVRVLNKILREHGVPLVIEPPLLRLSGVDAMVAPAESVLATATTHVDRFVLGERIGQGGFGTVYRATRTTSVAPFEYAIKLLDPSPFNADREKAAARFARESRVLQRLQHRAIVPVYETGMIDPTQAYILMPLIEGTTLRGVAMPVEKVLWTFQEILLGLEYLHGEQVIHRDLKPSNVMVRSSDQQPVILDFGCAFLLEEEGEPTLTTTLVGSAPYIPPEVHANPTLRDPRQDVYACGIMLYEMLRGHRPDPGDYAPLTIISEGLEPMDGLIKDAIAPFSKRLPSARAFFQRLSDIVAGA